MAKSYDELLAGAVKIMENELPESNTHVLVGTHLKDVVERMQDDDTQGEEKFTELEKKLKGDKASVNNGFDYPFVYLGSFADYAGLVVELDKLHSKDNSSQTVGNYRVTMNGNLLFVTNYVRSWADEDFIQYIEGTIKLLEDGTFGVSTDVNRFVRRYTGGAWTIWRTADRYDEVSDVDETYSLTVISEGSVTLGTYAVNKKSFYVKVEADETAFASGSIPARLYNGETFTATTIPLNQFYKIEGSNPFTEIALYYLPATITKATSVRVIIYKTNDLAETLDEMGMAITAQVVKNAEQDKKIVNLDEKLKGDKASVNNGFSYPFVFLGSFVDYAGLVVELDKLHSTDSNSQTIGEFRALMTGNLLFIRNYVRSWALEDFIQFVEGTIKLVDGNLSVSDKVSSFMRRYVNNTWDEWIELGGDGGGGSVTVDKIDGGNAFSIF